ncbi:nucleotidyltransferase family protein [Micromonospora sp. NPDC093277]|uniref:nucleotidyltransferase family protein n=1 Tax=Micromonospora sp. NPDC093277 TaxID=3364291 RepID=UPI00381629E7
MRPDDDNGVIMNPARFSLAEQLVVFKEVLSRNEVLFEVLNRAAGMNLPNCYVTSGAIFQTIWNGMTGRPVEWGIRDYDLFYFDDTDTSWEAEDAVIRKGREVFEDSTSMVEIRNQARVHLWYERKFGISCPPYESTEAAIDSFVATACSVGVRQEADRTLSVYAPYGLSDIFNMVVRPNAVQATAAVYEKKVARWLSHWPELKVLKWPQSTLAYQVEDGRGPSTRLVGDTAHEHERVS